MKSTGMKDKMSAAEYRDTVANKNKPSGSMFGNTWTKIDGINFQSKAEAQYYGRLKMRVLAKNIKSFECGVLYSLVVNKILICTYRADFVITHNDGTRSVVDVKSSATENVYSFKLKVKLMKALFGITVITEKK